MQEWWRTASRYLAAHSQWAPVPILFIAILLLWLDGSTASYFYPTLNRIFYFLFSTLTCALVACLIGRSFLVQGNPGLLMLGCGVVVWGSAGFMFSLPDINQEITFFNSCTWLSAVCHFAGALWSAQPGAKVRLAGVWLAIGYLPAFFSVLFVRMIAAEGWLPVFFVHGQGGTPLRQLVLGSAIAMFVITAALLLAPRRRASRFQRWYSPALVLIATGLFGVMVQSHFASPVGWAGRLSQYVGGVYMLIAALAAVRESRAWGITIEAELENQEATLTGILNAAQEQIWVFDREGTVLVANETALARFHKPAYEILGRDLSDVLPAHLASSRRERIDEAIRTRLPVVFEDEREGIHFHHSYYPVFDAHGRVDRVAAFSRDITQQKRWEAALIQAKADLEQKVAERTSELNTAVTRLQEAYRELDARAAKLRALAGELTMSEQRERKRLATTLHDGLQQYLVAAKLQLSGLNDPVAGREIESLLADAIAVSRTLAAELSPPILHDSGLPAGLEWLARWTTEKYGLRVKLESYIETAVLADDVKILLFECVRELLLNAKKHSGTGSVRVEVAEGPENTLQIVVRDSGRGFDPSRLRSGRVDAGFGLFSISERLGLIGGRFEIDSAPGRGARFTISAPLTETDESERAADSRRTGIEAPAEADAGDTIRILLVDDHAIMREGLARLLGNEPGFEIVGQAEDGYAAIQAAERLRPDIVLMDISMPRLNGIDAARIIHRDHPDIRIIGLSLYQEDEQAEEMVAAGAARYISKSGPADELKSAIRTTVRERDVTLARSAAARFN
jgi:PAS domain S-box-containing protein